MNQVLDHYADNPIIDELVFRPPKREKIVSVRACSVMFRKPFIEVELEHGETFHRHFLRDSFARFWAEACVVLETVTSIRLISEFDFEAVAEREQMVREILACRDECIEESNLMYEQGMYAQFLNQYGEDCKNLPPTVIERIAYARQQSESSR